VLHVAPSCLVQDPDAARVMIVRFLARGGMVVGEGAELVFLGLERVGVDRPEAHPVVLGVFAELGVAVHLVPRDVQRDLGGEAGVGVYLSSIRDFFIRVTGRSGGAEYSESSTRISESPTRQLYG